MSQIPSIFPAAIVLKSIRVQFNGKLFDLQDPANVVLVNSGRFFLQPQPTMRMALAKGILIESLGCSESRDCLALHSSDRVEGEWIRSSQVH